MRGALPRPLGGVGIMLGAALVAGCASQTPSGSGIAVSDTTVASKALRPDERRVAPGLQGTTLEGRAFDVTRWRGRVVVVNYWGSWCAPCREETPALVRAAKRTQPQGVRFLGINVRDSKASAQAFKRRYEVPYPSLYDPQMRTALEFGPMAPRALPATYVLDGDGRVAAFFFGAVTEKSLLSVVRGVVAESRDSSPAPSP